MKEKHIPSIVGLLLLLIILGFGIKLSLSKTTLFSGASGDCTPQGVQVTNLTHQSLDISFITKSSCSSVLSLNSRSIPNFSDPSLTHYFRVDNLVANTSYTYSLIVGGKEFKLSEYKIKTGIKPQVEASTSNLAWGRVINSGGSPSPNTIIYLTINGALPLSALSDSGGQWHISLANSFTENKDSWFIPADNQPEDLIVYSPDGQLTQISHNTSQNDPVPDITIGQSFFPTSPVNSGYLDGGSLSPTISLSGAVLQVNNPLESETINTLKPDIFGSGPASSRLQIKLESDPVYQDTVTTKNDGTWNWSPPANLSPGLHTLTVSYQDLDGLVKTLKRNFYVQAADNGNLLSFSATPSATIAPTPTLIPTIVPTSIPTVRASKPSTKSGVPVTGFAFPGLLLILSSFLIISLSLYYSKER